MRKEPRSNSIRHFLKLGISLALIAGVSQTAFAANWFKLRGTQPVVPHFKLGTPGADPKIKKAPRLMIWGFLQPRVTADFSDEISGAVGGASSLNGTYAMPATLPPDRVSQYGFSMRRARLGVRGTMLPQQKDESCFTGICTIDYFILTEFGENGVTRGGGRGTILDASVSFQQLSRGKDENGMHNLGARFRVGQFLFSQTSESLSQSTPGRRVHAFMPEATEHFALTRRVSDNGNGNFPGSVSVNGARDIGVEVFDFTEFKLGNSGTYEFTYSFAVGNGGTIGEQNRDNNIRKYAWLSFGKLFDKTRGPRRHDLMLYGFWQQGDILFNNDINDDGTPDHTQINPITGLGTASNGTQVLKNGNEREYEQTYLGYGIEYFDKPFPALGQIRFEMEYQEQEGFIFDGALSPSAKYNSGALYAPDAKSSGWYVDLGYDLQQHIGIKRRITVNARYDVLERNKGNASRAVNFKTMTLTGEYFFHPKARISVTYQDRDFDADDRTGGAKTNGNAVLGSVGKRIATQLTFVFM